MTLSVTGVSLLFVSEGAANRIRELRGLRGLSLDDIADELRVSTRTVRRWEDGEVRIDDDQKLALARLLRVSVPWMMRWPEIDNDGEAA